MAEYSDSALEFWSAQDDKIHLGSCPCCGLNSYTIICEHCAFDIAKYYENLDIFEAQEYILQVQV